MDHIAIVRVSAGGISRTAVLEDIGSAVDDGIQAEPGRDGDSKADQRGFDLNVVGHGMPKTTILENAGESGRSRA